MAYQYHESFMHKNAVRILTGMLRKYEKRLSYRNWYFEKPEMDVLGLDYPEKLPFELPFVWKPSDGIFSELKFHEKDNRFYFQSPEFWVKDIKPILEAINNDPDTGGLVTEKYALCFFDPEKDRGKILFVPDIVIFDEDKGAKVFIEVVHKNPLSFEKLNKYRRYVPGAEVYQIKAENVMNQTNRFVNLRFEKVL